ncbi:MAG: UDP-glucose 4-epimerase GalE [Clostridiales bacterium]|nr:UDP-glucose 4-epimerase GalE [Clostridiales bacterium]
MKILLTGGAGYIGSHTAVELLNKGYEIVIADNFSNSDPKVLDRIKQITNKTFVHYEVDVSDYNAFEKVFIKEKIDTVIHFAGYKAVGESVKLPMMYYENNLMATITLINLMNKYGVENCIFSSSAAVYDSSVARLLTEETPLSCTNTYGYTKLMSEQIFKDAARANPRLSIVLLRYFNPIGSHESGMIGDNPNGIPNNLLPFITRVAIGKLERLSVFGNDYDTRDGTGVRDYIHVVDLALGHIAAIDYCKEHKGAIAINLGTGKGYSVLEIVHAFEKASGRKIPYVFTARREGDVDEYYASTTLAKQVLGWEAKFGIEQMCASAWNWQKQNPDGY